MKKKFYTFSKVGKKALSFLFAVIVIAGMIPAKPASAAVSWPGFNSSKPIKTYTIANHNKTTAYSNTSLTSKKGTIYASDEIYVYSINKNSSGRYYAYVSYPTGSGRKYAYIPLSDLTSVTMPNSKHTAASSVTTYRRPGGSKAGSISKNDVVYKLAESGGYVQVLYNIGSRSNPTGWRMAWITTSAFNSYISKNNTQTAYNPQGCVDEVSALNAPGTFRIRGWRFDRNSPQSSLTIHVYVGGPAGSGAPCYALTANKSRPDVNRRYSSYGLTNNTGFDNTYTISGLSGRKTIYIYRINKGLGSNVLIGSKTIDIKAESKPATNNNSNSNSNSNSSSGSTTSGGVKYASYNGVNYELILKSLQAAGKIGTTEYNNRLAVLKEAQKMVTVIWKAPVTFNTWKSTSGSYNSNKAMQHGSAPSTAKQFVKGYTYKGIPYRANAGYNNYNAEEWLSLINEKGITKTKLEGTVKYRGVKRTATTFRGTDCSGFVHSAYSKINSYTYTDSNRLSCADMMDSSDWVKIKASDAKPGDILLKSGHVMIYLGKNSSGQVAVFECVADGSNGMSGCRYYTFNSVSNYNYYRFANISSSTAVATASSKALLASLLGKSYMLANF